MLLIWDPNAWEDYLWWQAQDRKVCKRINLLIRDIVRNGNEGIGNPEPLKHDFAGYWSRRITNEHRLVYKATAGEVRIAACRYHYGRTIRRLEWKTVGKSLRAPRGMFPSDATTAGEAVLEERRLRTTRRDGEGVL